jgi:hypothetical protein
LELLHYLLKEQPAAASLQLSHTCRLPRTYYGLPSIRYCIIETLPASACPRQFTSISLVISQFN